MFLNRDEPGSELSFGEVNPPLVKKRVSKKSDQRESYQEFIAKESSDVIRLWNIICKEGTRRVKQHIINSNVPCHSFIA